VARSGCVSNEPEKAVRLLREFSLRNDVSNKFWLVEQTRSDVVTKSGRIGALPREIRKTFESESEARVWADRQASAKLNKGYVEGVIAELGPWQATDWSTLAMDIDVFWRLLALFDWSKNDHHDVTQRAVKALSTMAIVEINEFSEILARLLYSFDTREFCRAVYAGELDPDNGEDYISVDDFLYCRCDLVGNGRAYYDAVVADRSQIIQGCEFEHLLSVADFAYELKTGEDYEYDAAVSYESFSTSAGWAATTDTMPGTYTGPDVPLQNRRTT